MHTNAYRFFRFAPRLLFAAAGLAAAAALHAQPLTLDDALAAAARVNPSVTGRRAEVNAARSELSGAQWQRFPSPAVFRSNDSQGATATTVRLQQPLWTAGRITANIEAAEARLQGARADLANTRLDVMARTASAYAEVIRLRNRLVAADRNVEEHRRLDDMIKRRVQSEIASGSDAIMTASRLQQAIADRIQLQTQAANAAAQLAQLIARPVREADVVAPPMPMPAFASVEEAQAAGESFAPALARAQADEAAALATAQARRATLFPQISARYEHIYGGNYPVRSQALIAIEYQPGAGLSNASSIEASQARVDSARFNREQIRMDLLERIRTDWNEVTARAAQLEPLRSVKGATEEVADSFARQYTVGRKSWIEVLNAQTEATQARYALADTEASLMLALTRLHLYTGKLTTTASGSANDD